MVDTNYAPSGPARVEVRSRTLRVARLVVLSLFCLPPCARAGNAPPAEVDALAQRIPILDPSVKGCPSFIARGSMPMSDDAYDYEIVFTPKECRSTLFDPDDGTPLMICTLQDFVGLNLFHNELLHFSGGRFDISVQSGPGDGTLRTDVQAYLVNPGVTPDQIRFDIRDAVVEARDRSTIQGLADGSVRLTQQVDDNRMRIIVFAPAPSRNVSFGQIEVDSERYTSYHELILDGVDFTDPALAEPDFLKAGFVKEQIKNAADAMHVFTAAEAIEQMPKLGKVRRGIRGDQAAREAVTKMHLDWDDMKSNDEELLVPWLANLAKTNVTLSPPQKPWQDPPATALIHRALPSATQPVVH